MKWFDVNEFMPGNGNWVIVRATDINNDSDFWFMAYWWAEENHWEFFDEEDGETMKVTHWLIPDKIEENK